MRQKNVLGRLTEGMKNDGVIQCTYASRNWILGATHDWFRLPPCPPLAAKDH